MAQYYTDFSEALTAVDRTWSLDHLVAGEDPLGRGFWDPWRTGAWTVQEVAGELVIRHQTTDVRRRALLWPSAGVFADVEALCCVYVDTSTAGKRPAVVLRASGIFAAENGYTFEARKIENKIQISKFSGGSYTVRTNAAFSFSTGWYWIRAKAEGSDLSFRIWADGASEPGTWNLTDTDAGGLSSGFVGVFDLDGESRVSYFKGLRVVGTPVHQADWRWGWGDVAVQVPTVVTDAGCEGGKALQLVGQGAGGRALFVWDAVAPADEIRVLARFKPSAITTGTQLFRVRCGGYGAAETGYTIRPTDALTGVTIASYWRGDFRLFGAGACTWTADDWNLVRFQLVGKSFKVKVWPAAESEPAAWSLEIDDPDNWDGVSHQTIGQRGWFGVGSFAASETILWDWIAIGTDGDDVP